MAGRTSSNSFTFISSEICAPGSTAADEGVGCKECAEDSYKDTEGRDPCTQCEENESTLGETAATSKDACFGKKEC